MVNIDNSSGEGINATPKTQTFIRVQNVASGFRLHNKFRHSALTFQKKYDWV
jgi:hypothetical protein